MPGMFDPPLRGKEKTMKPNTKGAMEDLIVQARERIPFQLPLDCYCEGRCDECPFKLLEILDMELADWESRLKSGDFPSLDDVLTLSKNCKQVYGILYEKGLVQQPLV